MKRDDEGSRTRMTKEDRDKLEAEILESHARGQIRDAAERLVQGYGREVYGYLIGILPTHDQADEAFARFSEDLLKGFATFQGRSLVRTWAYVLARHAAATVLRGRAGDAKHEPLSNAEDRAALAQQARSLTAEWRKTSVKDAFRDLRRELSEEDQTILILRVDRDLPWREVARVTGEFTTDPSPDDLRREEARIKQRLGRAIEVLRRLGIERGLIPPEEA